MGGYIRQVFLVAVLDVQCDTCQDPCVPLGVMVRVGQNRIYNIYIYTICDRMYGEFPAKTTVPYEKYITAP